MMKPNLIISREYKNTLKGLLAPLGFKLYKKTFYRVCGDVLQSVMLYRDILHVSAEILLTPLSYPHHTLYLEGEDISIFREGEKKGEKWPLLPSDSPFPSTPELVEIAFREMEQIVKMHVIPFFERGYDAENGYKEMIELELAKKGRFCEHDFRYVCACMQFGDYQKACWHLLHLIDQNWGLNHPFLHGYMNGNVPSTIVDEIRANYGFFSDKIQNWIDSPDRGGRLLPLLHALATEDKGFIQNYIEKNTAEHLEFLCHPKW